MMKKENFNKGEYLILYPSNIIVRGGKKAAVYALLNNKIYPIPSTMAEVMDWSRKKTVLEQFDELEDAAQSDILLSYFALILDNNLGLITNDPELYPEMGIRYDSPTKIKSAVLEVGKGYTYPLKKTINDLDKLGCRHLEIHFAGHEDLHDLKRVLELTKRTVLRSIEIIVTHSPKITAEEIISIFDAYPKIAGLIVSDYSSVNKPVKVKNRLIVFTPKSFKELTTPSLLTYDDLRVDLHIFMEAQEKNVYLNQSLAIDKEGNVKNAMNFSKVFGNINERNLESIIDETDFKLLWNVSVDEIEKIKNSELRYAVVLADEIYSDDDGLYHMMNSLFDEDQIYESAIEKKNEELYTMS